MINQRVFDVYKWDGLSSYNEDSPYGQRVQKLNDRITGTPCASMLQDFTARKFVRSIHNSRWEDVIWFVALSFKVAQGESQGFAARHR